MKPTFKERLAYWFDSRMSKGTSDLIRLLAIVLDGEDRLIVLAEN